MEIINEYGSDSLRLYLLSSQAVRGEQLKFSKSGVHSIMKDIIIPLSNSIVFWKEYMNLYMSIHKSNPTFSVKNNIDKISNPINLWILKKYSEIRNEFKIYIYSFKAKQMFSCCFFICFLLGK